jgi:hypothetical protein
MVKDQYTAGTVIRNIGQRDSNRGILKVPGGKSFYYLKSEEIKFSISSQTIN